MNRLRTLYFVTANTAILTLGILLGTDALMKVTQPVGMVPTYRSLPAQVQQNYAHMTEQDVDDLLRSTVAMRYRYMLGVGVIDDEITSKFVNVDRHGIRSNGRARDHSGLDGAVWVLGGSTSVGVGVTDAETIPAQLEQMIGHPVINLAVRGYGSESENRLMTHRLRAGHRPLAAVFLDGINESCVEDEEEAVRVVIDRVAKGYTWEFAEPVTYAYRRITRRLGLWMGKTDPPERFEQSCSDGDVQVSLRTRHARLLSERTAMCALYRVACLTFVQPFTGVHGKQELPGFHGSDAERATRELWEELRDNWQAAHATFVSDSLDALDHNAYIDASHYSAEASRLIAHAMGPTVLAAIASGRE